MQLTLELAKRGAIGILDRKDLEELQAGELRVYQLMKDGGWYGRDEIERAAQGREGLRRARSLRAKGFTLERRKVAGTRSFEYRLTR